MAVASPAPSGWWPLGRGWTTVVIIGVVAFALLRGIAALGPEPVPASVRSDRLVVIGVTGRTALSATDRAVLDARLRAAAVGSVSIRAREIGDCAAAGWTTLGAGRRAAVGGLCSPEVEGGRIVDWDARVAAARANRGDARLGTLGDAVPGCIAAVGPGAALAAARSDGTVPVYAEPAGFDPNGALPCPVTLLDAGAASDSLIETVAARPGVALLVTGIGPAAGSSDPALQVAYQLPSTGSGWLTSASTRREGIVTLTDLTRTLIDFGRANSPEALPRGGPAVDGSSWQLVPEPLSLTRIDAQLRATAALSEVIPSIYRAMGLVGGVLAVILLGGIVLRRYAVSAAILLLGVSLPAAMMLTGAVPWPASDRPVLMASVGVWGWAAALAAVAAGIGRRIRMPAAIVATALSVAAFTADAALGAVLQPGSLLNSRPVDALRWYGFGNTTFAAYASAGLLLAACVANRLQRAGHRRAALVAVAAIGFGVVICQGWPSMGSDFGGVLGLTPGVLWLLLMLSGVRLTAGRAVAIGSLTVAAVAVISIADWLRAPADRSHLGNFVQRVVDGDAIDVVSRKAVAAVETVTSPFGVVAALVGVAAWFVVFRYALPAVRPTFSTAHLGAGSVLIAAIAGTVLNDAGIWVFVSATAVVVFTVGQLWTARLSGRGEGSPRGETEQRRPDTAR